MDHVDGGANNARRTAHADGDPGSAYCAQRLADADTQGDSVADARKHNAGNTPTGGNGDEDRDGHSRAVAERHAFARAAVAWRNYSRAAIAYTCRDKGWRAFSSAMQRSDFRAGLVDGDGPAPVETHAFVQVSGRPATAVAKSGRSQEYEGDSLLRESIVVPACVWHIGHALPE